MSGDDLALLRETVRSAFAELCPATEVRRQMATARGWDEKVWRRLSMELGLAGLAIPEGYGGSSGSAVELGIVFEEAGRSLLSAPLFATTALAVPLLLELDDADACIRYLPGICDGSIVATVVTSDAAGLGILDSSPIAVGYEGGTPLLTGEVSFVVDGASADLILVPVRTEDGVQVFAVERETDTAGSTMGTVSLTSLDPTRKQARLSLRGTRARRIGTEDATSAVLRAADIARVLLASEQVGAAAYCLETTVAYAKSRVQFGRPIGSFQAIKQEAADMLILVESARSAAMAAAQSAAGVADSLELSVAAAVAQSYCSEAFVTVASKMIQLHGGIGFTWEHDAHLYFKRAWTSRELLGPPEQYMETIAWWLTAS